MDTKWRLLVAIFILAIACALGVLIYIFQEGFLAVACFYSIWVLIPWGIIKGVVAIWDHHREHKSEE